MKTLQATTLLKCITEKQLTIAFLSLLFGWIFLNFLEGLAPFIFSFSASFFFFLLALHLQMQIHSIMIRTTAPAPAPMTIVLFFRIHSLTLLMEPNQENNIIIEVCCGEFLRPEMLYLVKNTK